MNYPTKYEVRVRFSATLGAVEEFVDRTRTIWLQSFEDRRRNFVSELLLREALTNAVVHGCGADPGKWVTCVLRVRRGKLFFLVRDDGNGFNWRSEWEKDADDNECQGRGMEILFSYASRVRFNNQGNQVAIAHDFRMRNQQ